jgi:CubicO group peptidase (beta-lactamase class C family)
VTWRTWTALVLAIPVALGVYFRPDRAIRVATGVVADSLCTRTFVSGLDPQVVFVETLERPGIRKLRWVMNYQLDRTAGTVDASVLGLLGSHSKFREGFGCVLQHGSEQPYELKSDIEALRKPKSPPLLADIAGPALVEPTDPALKAALDHAFEESATPPLRRTKAVVVVRNGKVIAERYAAGVGIDTQLVGFSMTKSVVNALLGILTLQGRISPSLPAPIPEWRGATDPRREIEVEHLMRMTTGLALDETNSGFDPASQMYLYSDMAGFVVNAPMIAPPGTRWQYSSAITQILARIIRDITGGPEQSLAFAWRELFNPLGMRHVTLQFDGSGTLQDSHNMLASARDWARFGLLYLYDGVVGGKAAAARRLGGFFRRRHARFGLRRRLLHQSQRASGRQRPCAGRDPARCILCVRVSRPAHRDPAVAAHGDRPARPLRRSRRRYDRFHTTGEGSDCSGGEMSR